jgi:hypothetical protein
MPEQKWTMRGEYMESCNCDYLCPCVYTNPQGPVTYDHCTAALVFRIDVGNYAETRLDGLKFALVLRSGKVMADGNWIFAGVVDERADDAQRQALAAVVSGEAGGPPGFIRENLVSDSRRRIQADRVHDGRAKAFNRNPRHRFLRDRRGRAEEPRWRTDVHRQYRPSCEPTPGPGARQGGPCAWVWSRFGSRRQGQQRPFRAIFVGGLGADRVGHRQISRPFAPSCGATAP